MLIKLGFLVFIFLFGILSGKRLLMWQEHVPAGLALAFMLAISMYVMLFIGSVGLLSVHAGWIWLFLFTLPGLDYLRLHGIKSLVPQIPLSSGKLRIFEMFCIACLCVFGVLWFLAASAPATEIDALIYHVALAKQWLKAGSIIDFPSNFHSYLPTGFSTLFAWAMMIGEQRFPPAYFSLLASFATVALLWHMIRDEHSAFAAWIAALIFVALPQLYHTAHIPTSDAGLALFAVASIYSFSRFINTSRKSWIVLSALFASVAAGIKYQGLLIQGIVCVLLLWTQVVKPRHLSLSVKSPLTVFCIAAFALTLPWYLHTWYYAGNPLFPAAYNLLGGPSHWNPYLNSVLHEIDNQYHHALGHGLLNLVLAPWRMTMDFLDYGGSLPYGITVLAMSPLLLICAAAWKQHSSKYFLSAALMFALILYFAQMHWGRWFQPAFVLMIPAIAVSMATVLVQARSRLLSMVVCMSFVIDFTSGLGLEAMHAKKYMAVVSGRETRDQFLRDNTWYYDAYQVANKQFPNDKIFLYSWYATYYLELPFTVGVPHGQGVVNYPDLKSGDALCARLHELGTTLILYDPGRLFSPDKKGVLGESTRRANALMEDLLKYHADKIGEYPETKYQYRTLKNNATTYVSQLYKLKECAG